jgi:DNA-binding GntR family transcriptional regulator
MKSQSKTHRPRRDAERSACSRVETTYQQLKRDIIEGVYTPRQRLVETDIASTLGVSRATLRAALIRLQHEGFIEILPNRGAQVRSFSVDEATHILQVREVLEGLAAALAAERATPAQLAELRSLVTDMDTALAAGDLLTYMPLVSRFHKVIIAAADNAVIEQFIGMLHAPLVRHQFRIILLPGRKDASFAEHCDILACLERRDVVGAEHAMRRHVAQLREHLPQASHFPIG